MLLRFKKKIHKRYSAHLILQSYAYIQSHTVMSQSVVVSPFDVSCEKTCCHACLDHPQSMLCLFT